MMKFNIEPIYERHTDTLMLYIKDVPSYCEQINNEVSVFRSHEDDTVIGFEINGINQILPHNREKCPFVLARKFSEQCE